MGWLDMQRNAWVHTQLVTMALFNLNTRTQCKIYELKLSLLIVLHFKWEIKTEKIMRIRSIWLFPTTMNSTQMHLNRNNWLHFHTSIEMKVKFYMYRWFQFSSRSKLKQNAIWRTIFTDIYSTMKIISKFKGK